MGIPREDLTPEVLWAPQDGPQTALLTCPIEEVAFGGARGGGKTDGVLGDWIKHSFDAGRFAAGMMVRRHLTELEETIVRSHEMFGPIGAKYHTQSKTWTMPWKARLKFRFIERDADAMLYQGHSYTRIYPEEAGNFPRFEPIQKLFATLRSAHGVPVGMRLTANPGGPGHQWFKARYIYPAPLGYQILTDTLPSGKQVHRIFIPSRVTDNKILMLKDPGYVDRLHMVGSPELVKAWLYGDWDIVAGAYFHHWSPKMLIPAFVPPRDWPRFMSMDWGSAKPFSIHWWAVADGAPITLGNKVLWLPRGALVAYREWYGMKPGQPNVGLKLDAEDIADGIMKRENAAGEYPEGHNVMKTHIRYRVGDPSMWKEEGGPSIAERMARHRPAWDKGKAWEGVFMRRADNARISGWDQLHSRMRGFDEVPMVYFMDNCPDAIRTIPPLQHDEIKMEDVDTDAEDHAADDVRYAAMSRPMPAEAPPLRSKPSQFTFDQVVQDG